MSSSMLYTMGMAIDRAAESGCAVSLLIDGQWVEGLVAANDGVGVVLECSDGHLVARTERISAVKVMTDSPYKVPISAGNGFGEDFDATFGAEFGSGFDSDYDKRGAVPMPGPRDAR